MAAKTQQTLALREFALAVQREICIRIGCFSQHLKSDEERRWARDGACLPTDLDTIKGWTP